MKSAILLLAFVATVLCDVYMHNPRGSNNRLDGGNNVNNDNRLFDSQNNNAGGYGWGPSLSFYEGSELSIEWTNQHSCGGEGKTECNIVLQYMCSDDSENGIRENDVRDGIDEDTIPNDSTYNMIDPQTETYVYGMHENYMYYMGCETRQRNMGLFLADQDVNGNSARFTRQDNNGQRHGFECNEERDYYPYWHPTPWKDIAVLTSDTALCPYFKEFSQNSRGEWGWCEMEDGTPAEPNYKAACEADGYMWKTWAGWKDEYAATPNVDCLMAPFSRDNHLGNAVNNGREMVKDLQGHASMYNWTLPKESYEPCIKTDSCSCVLRLRYNITAWEVDGYAHGGNMGNQEFIDATKNGENSPIVEDPYVEVAGATFALEINTDQYGRTFQDRSHVFHILRRPAAITGKIWNLNVRGKRGNIVQAYPSVEYDFVPVRLEVKQWDFIHFQWTGSDSNPNGRDGQGREQTDRSNIVQIPDSGYNMPITEAEFDARDYKSLFGSLELRHWMSNLGQDLDSCLSMDEVQDDQDANNCFELNAAEQYFNGGLIKMNKTGNYHYMSTRNNNFTNRSQKGSIKVQLPLSDLALALIIIGGSIAVIGGTSAAAVMYGKANPHSTIGGLIPEALK